MSDDKKTIIIYRTWEPGIMALSDEAAGQFIKAIYSGEPPQDPVARVVYVIAAQTIQEDSEKYDAKCERNRANASGRKRTQANASERTFSHYDTDTDTDTDTDSYKESVREKEQPKRTRFVAPTLEEVAAYSIEKGLGLDCERFVDFYSAKGWKVGSSPMKDWKAAARNWARQDRERAASAPAQLKRFSNFQGHSDAAAPSAFEMELFRKQQQLGGKR